MQHKYSHLHIGKTAFALTGLSGGVQQVTSIPITPRMR